MASRPASSRLLSAQLTKLNQLQHQQVRRIATTNTASSLRALRSASTLRPRIASPANAALSRQIVRSYASQAPAEAAKPRKSSFRPLRWAFRFVYLSVLGSIAYIGYEIYQDHNPPPQVPQDPSKKTLVILGKFLLTAASSSGRFRANTDRYRLGLCLPAEEARYRTLQCHCHLAAQLLFVHAPAALVHHWPD